MNFTVIYSNIEQNQLFYRGFGAFFDDFEGFFGFASDLEFQIRVVDFSPGPLMDELAVVRVEKTENEGEFFVSSGLDLDFEEGVPAFEEQLGSDYTLTFPDFRSITYLP